MGKGAGHAARDYRRVKHLAPERPAEHCGENSNEGSDPSSCENSNEGSPTPLPTSKQVTVARVGVQDGLDSTRGDVRRTAKTISGAESRGELHQWNIPAETMQELPGWLLSAAKRAKAEGDARTLNALSKSLSALADYNLRRAEALDKAARLDQGDATEVYEFKPIKFRGGKGTVSDGSHAKMEPSNIPPAHVGSVSSVLPSPDVVLDSVDGSVVRSGRILRESLVDEGNFEGGV